MQSQTPKVALHKASIHFAFTVLPAGKQEYQCSTVSYRAVWYWDWAQHIVPYRERIWGEISTHPPVLAGKRFVQSVGCSISWTSMTRHCVRPRKRLRSHTSWAGRYAGPKRRNAGQLCGHGATNKDGYILGTALLLMKTGWGWRCAMQSCVILYPTISCDARNTVLHQ